MDTKGQTSRRVLLWSLVGMILPLVAFPARMGLELARPSLVNLLYEMVFYGVVIYFFHRRASLVQLIGAAGVCLAFRLVIGVAFGLLIALMYLMEVGVSLKLGLSGYLPAILFHMAMAPFVLKPILGKFMASTEGSHGPSPRLSEATQAAEPTVSSVAVSRERGVVIESASGSAIQSEPKEAIRPTTPSEPVEVPTDRELSGFEKAVYYIGEHGSVLLAAVVDNEGLLLGSFARHQIEPDTWAPLALLLMQDSSQVLQRTGTDSLERLDLQLEEKRVVVARSEGCSLMVVSERLDDDLLNIRINQGLEMINRFVAERYGDSLNSNAERTHVSSAQ